MDLKLKRSIKEYGSVYVLTNPAIPGIVKIGRTSGHVSKRLQGINALLGKLPELPAFDLDCFSYTQKPVQDEKRMHNRFSDVRIGRLSSELFETSISLVRLELAHLVGDVIRTKTKPVTDIEDLSTASSQFWFEQDRIVDASMERNGAMFLVTGEQGTGKSKFLAILGSELLKKAFHGKVVAFCVDLEDRTLQQVLSNVSCVPANQDELVKWLRACIRFATKDECSGIMDFGNSLNLAQFIRGTSEFLDPFVGSGKHVATEHVLSHNLSDLSIISPFGWIERLQTTTRLILNCFDGIHSSAFDQIRNHITYQTAIARGAQERWLIADPLAKHGARVVRNHA